LNKSKFLSRSGFICLIVVMLLSLALSACEQTTTTAPAPTTVSNQPKVGGILKIGFLKDARCIGYPPAITQAPDTLLSAPGIENLSRIDQTGKMYPWLATDWKTDMATKSITLTLRKGVKFHDGTVFDAEACKWNIQSNIDEKRKELSVSSIDVVDANTVRVNLSNWDVDCYSKLVQYWGYMISPTAFKANGRDWAILNPVGTGPFTFVKWEKNVKVVYKKNPNYWVKDRPYLDGIEFTIIADPLVQLAALKGGEIDLIPSYVSPKDVKDLEASGFLVRSRGGWGSLATFLMFDNAHSDSPFANVKVRQAVGHAIDSKSIVDALYYGFAAVTNQWADSSVIEYNPAVKGYPYDPNKAKQLIADAGYPNGFKTTLTCNNEADTVKMIQAVQSYLKAAGIDAQIDAVTEARWGEMGQSAGWNNLFHRTPRGYDSLAQIVRFLHTTKTTYPGVAKSVKGTAALDKLIDQALVAPDDKTKYALVYDIQKMIIDDLALVSPLFSTKSICTESKKVHNSGYLISGPANAAGTAGTPEETWKE
jgi:peptide/nickel transport system substrate-binding protein